MNLLSYTISTLSFSRKHSGLFEECLIRRTEVKVTVTVKVHFWSTFGPETGTPFILLYVKQVFL